MSDPGREKLERQLRTALAQLERARKNEQKLLELVLLKQPTCPWCGSVPEIVVSAVQAFCSHDPCAAFTWNPSISAVDNMADIGVVDLTNFLGGEKRE